MPGHGPNTISQVQVALDALNLNLQSQLQSSLATSYTYTIQTPAKKNSRQITMTGTLTLNAVQ